MFFKEYQKLSKLIKEIKKLKGSQKEEAEDMLKIVVQDMAYLRKFLQQVTASPSETDFVEAMTKVELPASVVDVITEVTARNNINPKIRNLLDKMATMKPNQIRKLKFNDIEMEKIRDVYADYVEFALSASVTLSDSISDSIAGSTAIEAALIPESEKHLFIGILKKNATEISKKMEEIQDQLKKTDRNSELWKVLNHIYMSMMMMMDTKEAF